MADEPKAPPPREPLSYASLPWRSLGIGSTLLFIVACALASGVLLLCVLAIAFMAHDSPLLAWGLAFGLLVITIAFIIAGKKGLSAAVAILLAAIAAFMLMVGLCSQFTLRL